MAREFATSDSLVGIHIVTVLKRSFDVAGIEKRTGGNTKGGVNVKIEELLLVSYSSDFRFLVCLDNGGT